MAASGVSAATLASALSQGKRCGASESASRRAARPATVLATYRGAPGADEGQGGSGGYAEPEAPPDEPAEPEPGEPSAAHPSLSGAGTLAAGSVGSDASAPDSGSGPRLLSIARETWVFSEPAWDSRKLGYLRAGASVHRHAEPASSAGCEGGWYEVAPKGFVCVGPTATLEATHPVAVLSAKRPDLYGLPYLYALSRFPPPPLYVRLPSLQDQRRVEAELDFHVRKGARLAREPDYVAPPAADAVPELAQNHARVPGLGGQWRGAEQLTVGLASVRSGFALLGTFDQDGRRFGLTTELEFVPLDRTRIVRPSTFRGVQLSDEFALPVAFALAKQAQRFRPYTSGSGALVAAGALGWREAVALTGAARNVSTDRYYEALDGSWVRADQVVRVDALRRAPGWAKPGRKWVDVSILRQSLVAYEGTRPVFATLVSTGADGLGDPEKTHSTIQGTFLIHTKHITVTMDGDERGDVFDFSDVPFVQYFTEGYALHGTYWHDDFGHPRSHGCVNLSPIDAAWLFRWTTPEVPQGWHAALSARRGTVVYVHP